ncbi:MAG: DNA polymerase III subunit beta, partial [Pantoea sp. Brub]|nr:DNA polymerase III subunit beta [Pantoea sp. Brub]
MKFIIEREVLLKSLQHVGNLISSRPILPILKNISMNIDEKQIVITGTDLEIEIKTRIYLLKSNSSGIVTVPGRKFIDICRGLSEGSIITFQVENNKILIISGSSRFSLSTLPPGNFPYLNLLPNKFEFDIPQSTLKRLLELTQFSMANQDVRYYLNGIMLNLENNILRAIATNGHRLALCSMIIDQILPKYSIIIPRKGVIELLRLLYESNNKIKIKLGTNNINIYMDTVIFTSKLIDSDFPDCQLDLPSDLKTFIEINCELLKKALSRVSIITSEKFKGIYLCIHNNKLKITSNNLEQEEAEEILDISYNDDKLEMCFNVNYILDVLNVLKCKTVRLLFNKSNFSL